ncbi:HAD-IIA family hydrolase [Roseovarius sp.]|uniref:HAD-IIA family hydrolase n=1 Tax=Roseovarius sp. TaxID=1486281 RepID=UPI00356A9084
MTIQDFATLDPQAVATAKLVLCDLDGCLVSEGRVFPDTTDFVAACGNRLWIVSNNSTHTAASLCDELATLGIKVEAERILLAGEQTLDLLAARHPGGRLALYGSDCLRERAISLGLQLDADRPDIMLLCRDMRFKLPDLDRLTAQIMRGGVFWVANTDRTHPGLDGSQKAETGALLAMVSAVLGPVNFESIGKPHPHLARIALERMGIAAQDAVFVGDRVDTDGALARASNLPFLHIVREAGQ